MVRGRFWGVQSSTRWVKTGLGRFKTPMLKSEANKNRKYWKLWKDEHAFGPVKKKCKFVMFSQCKVCRTTWSDKYVLFVFQSHFWRVKMMSQMMVFRALRKRIWTCKNNALRHFWPSRDGSKWGLKIDEKWSENMRVASREKEWSQSKWWSLTVDYFFQAVLGSKQLSWHKQY